MTTHFGNFIRILIHGGTNSLRPSESSILAVLAETLPPEDRQILQCQISNINLVQRPQPHRMVICYYPKNSISPVFAKKDYEICLALIIWKHADKKKAKVKVMLHNGRFQSIEGHIPKDPISLCDCTVTIWPTESSALTEGIDNIEHNKTVQETGTVP